MVSGKPPRRSKSTSEPVTIDLEAEREPPFHDEGTKPEDMVADEPDAAAPQGPPVEPKQNDDTASVKSGDGSSRDALFGRQEHSTEEPLTAPPEAETVVRPRPAPSTSSLIAAGIFGGLIALACAGSMQYAGYLPGSGASTAGDTDALARQLSSLEARIGTLAEAPAPTLPDLEPRIAAIEQALQDATQAQSESADSGELQLVQQQVADMRAALDALRLEVTDASRSVSETENRLNERLSLAEEKIEAPRTDVEMARAVAVASLKSAVERGGPYLAELDTLAGISPDDPALARLKDRAATGVPSRAELVREFEDLADTIIAAVHQPESGDGLGQRLLASAFSVVKVRPVGNVEGETPEAIVARIEDKLRNGDLKGAELEWQNLPEAGKAASNEFAADLKARTEVEAVVGQAMAAATGTH